jgi:hypothetical protein
MVNAEDPEKDDKEKDLWKLFRQLMNFYIKTVFFGEFLYVIFNIPLYWFFRN